MGVASRRQRERQERRLRILAAAERVFFAKGFAAATMDEVAAEAELSKGTIYLYFKNKDDLFVATAACVVEGVARDFEEIAGRQQESGLAQIEAMMRAYARNVAEQPRHFRLAGVWLASGEHVDTETPSFTEHLGRVTRVIGACVAALARGQRDGSVRCDVDPNLTAARIWGGLFGVLLLRVNAEELARRFPQPTDFDEVVDGYIRLFCDGLRPPGIHMEKA